jgi:chemotaxis protein MotB
MLKTTDISQSVPSAKGSRGGPGSGRGMARLIADLQQAFDAEIKRNEISIRAGHEGIIITLREIGFFESGSAEVELKSEPTVARIAKLLQSQPYDIRIEGHTDNDPIHNNQFSSNWQLSTARAVGMTALFISSYGFPPDRISASGYAEFHPIALNSTPEGRFLNRRVDIVVLTGDALQSLQAEISHERSDATHPGLHSAVARLN